MTWVKVCGLGRESDLEAAAQAGADAVGLVLVEGSPRRLTIDKAARLGARSEVPSVILTRDLKPAELMTAVAKVGAWGIQPYGRHASQAARVAKEAGVFVLWPVHARGPLGHDDLPPEYLPVIDSYSPGQLGGTGRLVPPDWLPTSTRYVLAGGLNPDNVAQAVARHRPWGVDASSGLESVPGLKDPARIIGFVKNAKG